MKFIVDRLPENRDECAFKSVCPYFMTCDDVSLCPNLEAALDIKPPLEAVIRSALNEVGVSQEFVGHQFMIYALTFMYEHRDRHFKMGEISQKVAEQNFYSKNAVEQAIKNSLIRMTASANDEQRQSIRKIFGSRKITVGVFLKTMLDYIILKTEGVSQV